MPRFRLYTSFKHYAQTFQELLLGSYEEGEAVEELEKTLAQQFEIKHAICVSQARVGIYLAVKCLIPQGRELIMSPYTIADVVNMVICAGAKPVFCDLEPNTCNIDQKKLENLITPNTGGVLITHLHGLAADPESARDTCRSLGIPLIEDSAQAFGTMVSGKRTGTFGDAGIFSFGMYKNVNGWYGGVITTNDDSLMKALRKEIQSYIPESPRRLRIRAIKGLATDTATSTLLFKSLVFWIFRLGCLYDIECINRKVRTELDTSRNDIIKETYLRRMTQLQARLVLPQVAQIDTKSDSRIEKAKRYYQGLRDLPDIILPPAKFDRSHIYTYYPIRTRAREQILKWLMKHRCDIGPQHLKNCASLPGFREFGNDCPIAESTAKEIILLPTYPGYSDDDIERNIRVLRRFFQEVQKGNQKAQE